MRFLPSLVIALFALPAFAGPATVVVVYDQPPDPDLKECRFFLQNPTGGAIDNKTVAAADLETGGRVVFTFDAVSLQGTSGKVVARCVDAADQVSVDSNTLAVTFPDPAPGAPVLRSVQVGS